jgi:cobalt-zinc-cadmium efflux system outer membrane protein
MMRIVAAVLAAASCASIAQAQSAPVAPRAERQASLTLAQVLAEAERASPAREVANASLRAAGAARTVAGLRPNPRAFADVENFIGSGPYSGFEETETTIGLELPIERGGKRSARIALADAQTHGARVAAAVALADLRQAVTQAYVDAATLEARLGIARQQLAIATEGLRAADVRVRAGRAPPLESQRAEVARINAETAVAQAERQLATARVNLGARLSRPVSEPLDMAWFEQVVAAGSQPFVAAEETLALAAAEAELASAEAGVRLARAQRVPDISLSAGARRLEGSGDTAAVFGVSIPLQIFNSGNAAVEQASAERDRAAAQRRVALLEAETAIRSAETDLANAAEAARTAAGPALAAAQEAARIARIGYREGKFGQLDLLEAERTLAAMRTTTIDALSAYHAARARLARLTAAVPTGAN